MTHKNSDDKDIEYQRKSDVMLIELNTKFNDFMSVYGKAEDDRKDWRDKFEHRLTNIEGNVHKMLFPYRITLAIFSVAGGAFLVEVIKDTVQYFKDHIHYR